MAGTEYIAVQKHTYDFTNLAQGVATTLAPIPVAYDIDVKNWREATLEVLMTQRTIPTGGSVAINVYATGRSDESPGVFFIDPSGPVAAVTITPTSPNLVNTLARAALSANFGPIVSIALVPTVGTATGTFSVEIEIRLSLKV